MGGTFYFVHGMSNISLHVNHSALRQVINTHTHTHAHIHPPVPKGPGGKGEASPQPCRYLSVGVSLACMLMLDALRVGWDVE